MPARSSNDLIAMLTPADRSLSSDIARNALHASSVAAPAVLRLPTTSSSEKINDQRMTSPDMPPPTGIFGRESLSQPTLLAASDLFDQVDYFQGGNLHEVDMKSLSLEDHGARATQPAYLVFGVASTADAAAAAAAAASNDNTASTSTAATTNTRPLSSVQLPPLVVPAPPPFDVQAPPPLDVAGELTSTTAIVATTPAASSWTRAMPKPRSKTKVTSADAVPPLSLAQVSPRGTSSTVSPRGSGAQVSPRNAQVSPRNAQVSPRNAATQQVSPRGAQQSPRTTSASPRGSADAVSPRSSGGEVPSEADVGADGKPRCHMCGTDSTPQWRRTLDGKGHAPLLCNSCGLKERRAKKRLEEAMREGRVRDDGTIERRAATRDDDSSSKKSKSPPARNKTRSRTGPIANVASVIATPGSSASSSAATSPRGHEFSCSNPVYSGPEPISVGPRSTSGRRAAVAAAAAIAANVGSTSPSSSTSAPAVPPPPPPFMLTGFGVLQDHSLGLVPPPPPLEAALLMPRANATAGAPPMRALASSQGALLTMLKQEKQETPMSPALTSPKRRRRLNAEGDSGRAPEESEDDNKHR